MDRRQVLSAFSAGTSSPMDWTDRSFAVSPDTFVFRVVGSLTCLMSCLLPEDSREISSSVSVPVIDESDSRDVCWYNHHPMPPSHECNVNAHDLLPVCMVGMESTKRLACVHARRKP